MRKFMLASTVAVLVTSALVNPAWGADPGSPPTPSTPAVFGSTGLILVSWAAVAGTPAPTGYKVYRAQLKRDGTWASPATWVATTQANGLQPPGTSFLDLNVRRGTTYRYSVSAFVGPYNCYVYNTCLESDQSQPAAADVLLFSYDSPWQASVPTSELSTPSDQQFKDLGAIDSTYTVSQAKATPLLIAGGTAPSSSDSGAPIFQAETGDNTYTFNPALTTATPPGDCIADPSWGGCDQTAIHGDYAYDGNPIPMPPNSRPEGLSDAHIGVINSAGTKEYDFWYAHTWTPTSPTSIKAGIVAEIPLGGCGYDTGGFNSPSYACDGTHVGTSDSARASGEPLAYTGFSPAELYYTGIHHAMGISVPRDVASGPKPPIATHSDGSGANGAVLQYGQRVVLRSDFTIPGSASLAQKVLLTALKTYGAFIDDRYSSDLEIDAANNYDPAGLRSLAGFAGQNTLNNATVTVTAGDFRLAPSIP